MSSKLMQLAIDQIRSDLEVGDVTAIQVLLQKLDKDDLYYFLSEENQALANHFEYEYDGQFDENLEIEIDDISHLNENDGQPDEAQEWHDYDPDC